MNLRAHLNVHCLGCAIGIWHPLETFALTRAKVEQNHRLLLVDQNGVERKH